MRRLMWFTLGFGAACALLAYGLGGVWPLPVLLAAALGCVGLALRSQKRRRPALCLLTGLLAGSLWFSGFQRLYLEPLEALNGQTVSLSVTATDYSADYDYRTGVDGVTTVDDKTYQIRVYLEKSEELPPVSPGDVLQGGFRLMLTLEGGSSYLQGSGIFLVGYGQTDVLRISGDSQSVWCFPAVLRQRIMGILEECFPADTAPFAKALLLGDTDGLDYETATALEVSGIRHIVAVSGLHVSVLYGALCILTLRRRYLTALVGLPTLLLFAAVAGFTPSVVRSCVMTGLTMLALVVDREYDPATGLSFAVLVMLLLNPLAITSVSLQLSAGCVAGIILFNGKIDDWLKSRLPKRKGLAGKYQAMLCGSVAVTVNAMSLITPLSAWYFGAVSLVSPVTNLLTLWAVELVFVGLLGVCLVYFFSAGLAGGLAWLLSWPVRYVLGVAKALAGLPLAAVYTKSIYIVCWLVFLYLLLALFLAWEKKRPGVLLCCAALGLCVALTVSWLEPLSADTTITMLDVGQGQSILLQSEGKTFLVDCGGDSDTETADLIAETLLSQGIRRLDGIILTHYDRDHAGGIYNLLTRVDTDWLFLPDTQNTTEPIATTGQTVWVWDTIQLSFGSGSLTIYGPVYSGLDNENSLCVLFDTEKCDILITGDRTGFGERMLLRSHALPDVDILVAGHHGDAEATTQALLEQVRPELVLISVGENNFYGHPSPALLERLEAFGCAVLRTDQLGTITVRR